MLTDVNVMRPSELNDNDWDCRKMLKKLPRCIKIVRVTDVCFGQFWKFERVCKRPLEYRKCSCNNGNA